MDRGNVAVVLLNFNQWEMTAQCVESILKSDYPDFRVLLIENGSYSQDDYERLMNISSDRCDLVHLEENLGYVGGMNYGMKLASERGFDFFLVMNNDAVIASDSISRMIECSEKYGHRCIVTGKVYHYDRPGVIQHIGYEFTDRKNLRMRRLAEDVEDKGQWDMEREMDMIDDIFWLFPNELYKRIGGYSRYFWFNAEQADLALRAVKAGYKLVYTPDARLWHMGSISIGGRGKNPRLAYYDLQGSLVFRFLHLSPPRFILYYISVIFNIIRGYLKHFAKLLAGRETDGRMPFAGLRALLWFNGWFFSRGENNGANPFA